MLTRRQALVRMGLTCAGLASLSCAPGGRPVRRPPGDDVDDLADRFRSATREEAFDVASQAIASGATREALLGAIFLAGVEDIRPRPHGILHSVMMVESTFQLSEASPAQSVREAWHPVFFNLDDFKRSQESDRREWDDFRMEPLPDRPGTTANEARREFVAAMDDFDAERAERAAAALARHVDAGTFFEILRPYVARCYAFIGHKTIYAVQVERTLARLGWQRAEPALRSLVLSLLVGRQTDDYRHTLELAPTLPANWSAGSNDAADTDDLLRTLRSASPREAQQTVVEALKAGLGPSVIWDALVLLGSEVFSRRPGQRSADGRDALLPVHALTVPSAQRSAFLAARSERDQRWLLLQAAAWTPRLRDDLASMVGLSMEGAGFDGTPDGDADGAPSLDAVFESGSPGRVHAWLDAQPADADNVLSRLRHALARTGREHHQHKYAAAMAEEASRVPESLRPRLIAPAVGYIAHPADEETDVFQRAERALDLAGIP